MNKYFKHSGIKRIAAALLTAVLVLAQLSPTSVFAEKPHPDISDLPVFSDNESSVQGEYVPGEAIICVLGSEEDSAPDDVNSSGFNPAVMVETDFLMDVSDAVDSLDEEEASEIFPVNSSSRSENNNATGAVLKLVRSDTLSTEELIGLYSCKPEVLFAEPNYILSYNDTTGNDPEDPDGASDNEAPVPENASGNSGTASGNSASENKGSASENKGSSSGNSASGNSVSENTVSDNSLSDNAALFFVNSAGSWNSSPSNSPTPNMTGKQYAYGNGSGGIDVPGWNDPDNKNAQDVVVAVLDSGVDYNHEDLDDVMWDEGLDYPALKALGGGKYGINTGHDFWRDDKNFLTDKDDPMDEDGHGTHCAGIIAAEWNDIGISGAANGVKIMAVKHVTNTKGQNAFASTIAGYNYILQAKKAGVNVVAVNCSFGGVALGLSDALCVRQLGQNEVVTCFASGNDNLSTDICSSASSIYTNIPQEITVDSIDEEGKKSDSSNYGKRTTDIFAPGTRILSTYPNSLKQVFPGFSLPIKDASGNAVSLIVKVVVSKKPKNFVAICSSCLSGFTMTRISCK